MIHDALLGLVRRQLLSHPLHAPVDWRGQRTATVWWGERCHRRSIRARPRFLIYFRSFPPIEIDKLIKKKISSGCSAGAHCDNVNHNSNAIQNWWHISRPICVKNPTVHRHSHHLEALSSLLSDLVYTAWISVEVWWVLNFTTRELLSVSCMYWPFLPSGLAQLNTSSALTGSTEFQDRGAAFLQVTHTK